jgi:DNA-binding NarL/FixJ family response regulator
MKRVLVAVPDLLFAVQIANAVRAAGGEPQTIRRVEEAYTALDTEAESYPAAVVIDLAARIDPPALIQTAAARHVPVFAFGPHLDIEAIKAARVAGADKVVTNSALAQALPGWLAGQINNG